MAESVGNILKSQRAHKKFTLEDVHKFVKIHPTFLRALEEGDYSVFSNKEFKVPKEVKKPRAFHAKPGKEPSYQD